MDEKMQELLNAVQQTAVSVGASASDVAYSVGKKADQLLSVGKLNVQIMDLKTTMGAKLREVGELVYATHTGSPSDSEVLLSKLEEIDGIRARIDALAAEQAQAKGGTLCPHCGAAAGKGDVFCRRCGGKL
jgi:hypothetical protein